MIHPWFVWVHCCGRSPSHTPPPTPQTHCPRCIFCLIPLMVEVTQGLHLFIPNWDQVTGVINNGRFSSLQPLTVILCNNTLTNTHTHTFPYLCGSNFKNIQLVKNGETFRSICCHYLDHSHNFVGWFYQRHKSTDESVSLCLYSGKSLLVHLGSRDHFGN